MPAVAVTIGQVINNYRIVRQIGEGGMGAVFEVAHIHIGQRAALKAMTVDLKAHPGLFQRFVNEARAAGQIDHPCVVKVMDFGQFPDGSPWMIMEFLKGESLSARLSIQPLGVEGLWIIADLASALAATHAAGIVHRDLKPGNIMLVPDPLVPAGERAKLLDFGVAKLCDDSLTKSGAMLGTPMYMAPEQIKNSADVDGQADVYALGVILYQLLCGRLPYEARETFALLAAKSFYPPIPLSQHAPTLPPAVQALTMAMLEREPSQRPTMVDVEVQVRRVLGLPPPRPSGWHNVVAAAPAPRPRTEALSERDGHSGAITADAPASEVAELTASPPTPSWEKAAGELSPRNGIEIPLSLSSMPSVSASISPALRAAPEAQTAKGAPAPLVPAARAAPTAPTTPDSPRRPRYIFFGAALAFLSMGTWAALRDWHPRKSVAIPELRAPVDLSELPRPMDLAVSPDLMPPLEPAPKILSGHTRKEREKDHGKVVHSAAKEAELEAAVAAFEINISGASTQQEKLIRACCERTLKSLTTVPHTYKILLERSGTLHIIEAPEAVRQTDLALCLRQAFSTTQAPETVSVRVRGSR